MRAVDSYSGMLQEFFGRLGKPPDLVTAQDVFAYAHGTESSKGTFGRGNKTFDVIPDSQAGLRDRAIITTLVLTGRRRSEVLNLEVEDLQIDGDTVFYTYRGKGGKRGRRELPQPAYVAITASLTAFGKELWPQ